MKNFIFVLTFMLFSITCFGQFNFQNGIRQFINEQDYELVDSLPLERFQTYVPDSNLISHIEEHSNGLLNPNRIISLGDCEYMFELPIKDKILLKYNKDRTKAIITNINSVHGFGLHFFEFNVKDDKRRQILYYDDDNVLCGLIYDKYFKAAKYFRYVKNEIGKRRFHRMRRMFKQNF